MYPREFRALEHAANGGSIDDLFKPGEPDYSKMEIPEDDEEYQKQFMQNYYIEKKGFSRQKAARMVESDLESTEGIFEQSKAALKEMAVDQEKTIAKQIDDQKQLEKQNRQQDTQMIGVVESVVNNGKLNTFTIPTKEREEFFRYSLNHIQRNPSGGGYMFALPLNPQALEQQLQDLYFAFKKGDLTKIIQRSADTESTRRLKRNALKNQDKSNQGAGGDDDRRRKKGSLPGMEDFTVD
jgi:hypothetical protein